MAEYMSIDEIAATLPTWKVLERFWPGIAAISSQEPGGPETLTFPDGDGPTPEEIEAKRLDLAGEIHARQHVPLRAAEYPAIGDQLDALLKGFAQLGTQGATLPPDLAAVIDTWQAVKAAHPKPVANA
jgi:hypothetical protein